jgi:hypothetical protein
MKISKIKALITLENLHESYKHSIYYKHLDLVPFNPKNRLELVDTKISYNQDERYDFPWVNYVVESKEGLILYSILCHSKRKKRRHDLIFMEYLITKYPKVAKKHIKQRG